MNCFANCLSSLSKLLGPGSQYAKKYSDLDLAVVGAAALDRHTLARLKEAFEDSDLPIQVDVLDWQEISQSFKEIVAKDYAVLQEMPDGSGGRVARR